MTAPESIQKLVERFESQRADYKSGRYNETQLRNDFLDPLFEALGWDVNNRKNYSEKYREVVKEASVEVDGAAKAADYAFQSGGHTHFFLEAKKPSVNIETSAEAAFQIRRYAWSKKLALSALSDFEQLAVYDCRQKPSHGDAAHVGRLNLYSCREYVEKWDEIYGLLSYEAVHQGSLDKFLETSKGKRGTADVDDAFLAEMEGWREHLARNIALRNPGLGHREINTSVQLIIDRLIFLRICEDRGIEPENGLRDATDGLDVYGDLLELFRKADKRYNSGLFHFDEEKGQSSHPDKLTPALKIDDKVFKDILANLYPPKSPYAFTYFSAEILGQVYERFLGKVIRLTEGGHARVEEKPEVRKAGGVYYTPTYIVEYIVKNTLGELLKDKTPADLLLEPLRVLDPACGSGSFLLGAYQYLLDWTLDWYTQHDPARWARGKNPPLFETDGGYQLTMEKKKELLTAHIYGVDIDPQAVEVTKLSLLLKVVENPGQLSLLEERILPDLGDNIKCGNSLIGPDYYEGRQMSLLDAEEQYRVNAFDWHSAFPAIFKAGGFDAVIGNPPYIRIQALKEWAPKEVEFYKTKYVAASRGNYDIYVVFVEKGLELLNQAGKLGFILPTKFFATDYGEGIRRIISTKQALNKIVDFGHYQIFDQATTYTCLLFLNGKSTNSFLYSKVENPLDINNAISKIIDQEYSYLPWSFSHNNLQNIHEKLLKNSLPLKDLPTRIARGSSSGLDPIFMLERKGNQYYSHNNELIDIEENILRTPIFATDFGRYKFHKNENKVIIFPYKVSENGYSLFSEIELKNNYPKAFYYLNHNKQKLLLRKQFTNWYGFSAPRNLDVHEIAQILVPLLANKGLYCRLDISDKKNCLMASGGFSITISSQSKLSPNYVLGLLNSTLLFWQLSSISNLFRGGWITCTKQYVETLPIHLINFSNPAEVKQHDRMVALVEQMLALHKQSAAAKLPDEKERLQRQIDITDKQIDKLVYGLYGLTDDEIKIVESTP